MLASPMEDAGMQRLFALVLRESMRERGLDRETLAQLVGVSPGTISRWTEGDHMPRGPEVLGRLSEVLGVPIEALIRPPAYDLFALLSQTMVDETVRQAIEEAKRRRPRRSDDRGR